MSDEFKKNTDKFDTEYFLKAEKNKAFKEYVAKCDKNKYVSYPKFEREYNLRKWLK